MRTEEVYNKIRERIINGEKESVMLIPTSNFINEIIDWNVCGITSTRSKLYKFTYFLKQIKHD